MLLKCVPGAPKAPGAPHQREGSAVYARSSTFLARPETIDDGIAFVRDEVMPAVMALDGCIGLSMICDRESGRCIATTAWSSEDAMSSSEQRVQPMRQRGAEIFGGETSVDLWEMAVLHRHVSRRAGAEKPRSA